MSTEDYLKFLASKIAEAEARENLSECIRLAGVGIQALQEYIGKCEYQKDHP